MFKMFDSEFIRKKHFVEGWLIRKISRQFGISRQSVRRVLASSDPHRYKLSKPRPIPVMDRYRPITEAWLAEDEKAPAKQRHTAKRIFVRLQGEYQFKSGESTVRRFSAGSSSALAMWPPPFLDGICDKLPSVAIFGGLLSRQLGGGV